ncbi:MAG: imidazole glycerol phosphate synthase subunit HisH [Pseudomonadota bacterium]|nr:imidazole glycerol phosphate synthase subunit HisH [Pseudomonadota bacterium]
MIAVVDSGGANISSIMFALERVGITAVFTRDAVVISNAERVILPGVGTAEIAMSRLKELNLIECIRGLTQPVLGICLGMQILFEYSSEGNVDLLGVFPGNLMRFDEGKSGVVPHMGWNNVRIISNHRLTDNIPQESYFYFVHSYYAHKTENTVGVCYYGDEFSAIVAKDNFIGCQFHPERSGKIGEQLLDNFLKIKL